MSRLRDLLHVARTGECNAQFFDRATQLAAQQPSNSDLDLHSEAGSVASQLIAQQACNFRVAEALRGPSENRGEARIARLRASFDLVVKAFSFSTDEIELAWSLAIADLPAAESAFHANAAMIRAGWKPLEEQAAAFLERLRAAEADAGEGTPA